MEVTKKELAQVMFEAYNAQGPNPNKTFDGRDVPPWEKTGDQVQGKWRAAAKAAVEAEAGLTFGIGMAIKQMWSGKKVQRAGWNGKGMFLMLQVPDAHSKMKQPYIFIVPVGGEPVPWVAAQPDLLGTDWSVVVE